VEKIEVEASRKKRVTKIAGARVAKRAAASLGSRARARAEAKVPRRIARRSLSNESR